MADPGSVPSTFHVTVLRPFEVWRDGLPTGAASWQRSAQTLLKLLVVSPERRRLRDEVIDTLWPDATLESGSNNLRYVLRVLRGNLGGGDPSPIVSDRTWITLNPLYSWDIDLARFEELAGRAVEDKAARDELGVLYGTEPLIEDRYDNWAAPLRTHIQRTWRDTCLRCAESLRVQHQPESALVWLERALEIDPLDEDALHQMLELLIQLGRRSEALRCLRQFEQRLKSELDIEPSPETRALLFQMPQSAEGAAGPPSRVDAEAGDASPSQRLLPGAYLGALPSVPLVERQEELGRLTAGINAAMEGRGRLMLLVGEPGVGKTRLAQEATAILQERGVMIATGRCYEPEQSVPYYPFLDVLADIARQIQGELHEQIPYRWPYLLRLLPELQPLGAALPSSSLEPSRTGTAAVFLPAVSGDEPLIIRAVAGFLDAVAAGTPLAILLDDLHWSDSATVKLLLHLARHSGGRPIFLLGTYRDLDVTPDHPLHGALIDLGRERLMEKIMLRRLDLRGTEALIAQTLDGGVLPPGLVEIVHEPADGNPFFVGEIVRSMMEEGTLFRKNGTWGRRQRSEIHVPESVRAVLGQRLARLTDGTRTVLHAASVLGQTFRFDEVEGVSGLSEEEVEEALDEAAGAGLLREMDPDVFAFSHALVQGAVYEDLTARRQRRLHLTAAEIIEAGPERERRCGEIASHFLRAGDTARAIPYWILAGDAAQGVFAYAEAEQHYRAALEAAHTTADTAQEAAALERLGTTLLRQAQYAEALECVRAAAHAYRSLEDREGELRAGCLLGEVLQIQGKHREAFATLLALRVSPDDSSASPGMVQMHLRLSEIAMDLKEYEQQEELVVQALQIAETLGDRRLLVRANLYLQGALWYRGRPNDVFTALKEYVRLLEGESDLVELFRFTHILALMAMLRGDLQASREYSERALDLARRVGDPLAIPNALHQLASALFLLGDWPVARMHLESARALAQSIDAATPLLYILSSLGHLTVCEGDWDAGEELLQEAGKVVQETDVRDSNLMQHQFLANLDLLRGHPQKAVQRLTPLLERSSDEEMWSTPLVPLLACAYLGLGDIDRAEMFVRDSLRRAERDSNRLDLVQGLFALAGVREKEGRADEARAALQDALRHARDMSFPAAQAEALFRLGSLELECGDSGAARTSLTSAREIWERLGARKDLERVDEALQGSRSAGV